MNPLPRKTPVASPGSSLARLTTARSGNTPQPNVPGFTARLTLKGDRHYLRALRAAEMIAWAASGGDALRRASVN